jgi:hypothetical protein
VIAEIKGEADRLKTELGLAKETASRRERELDALAEKLEALECERECTGREGAQCTVCLVRPAQIAAVPCGHRFVCTSCAIGPDSRCYVCRAPMTGTLRVF